MKQYSASVQEELAGRQPLTGHRLPNRLIVEVIAKPRYSTANRPHASAAIWKEAQANVESANEALASRTGEEEARSALKIIAARGRGGGGC